MPTRLLRTCFLLLIWLTVGALPAAATHLLGGEMNYKYLDANGPTTAPFRYQVTVLVYLNKESGSVAPDGRLSVDISFYNKSQNGARIMSVTVPRTSFVEITPPSPGTCTLPNSRPPRVTLAKYVTVVNLPNSFEGYYAVYTDAARNVDVTNLLNPGGTNMTLYADIAPPLLPNTSPVFSDTAVAVICQGDTSLILNNAYDADGDRLTYTFGTPYQGSPPFGNFTPPPLPVDYATGYSQTQPFGPGTGSFASLNASTGLSRYATRIQGKFVVAVDVKEYRTVNGREVLVGTTRRDIQLVSRVCQPNQAPVFSPPSVSIRDYTIEEGQTVNFNIVASDPENQSLVMRVNSVLLDGNGPFNASLNNNQGTLPSGTPIGGASVSGTSPVTGAFRFASRCGDARATPYDVVVTVSDNTCSSKSIAEIFRITVTRASGPNRIAGDSVVCDRGQARTYTAQGPVTGAYRWVVRGGTIQGSATGRTIQVLWGAASAGSLRVQGLSVLSCPTDSAFKAVNLRAAGTLTASPNVSICLGGSTTLTASGGQTYTWTGGGQTFTGASITVTPTQTTTYTVQSTDGTCTYSRQVTVTVTATAVANAGSDLATCSGAPVTLGTAALTGYTYQWSPATGLSSATAAQPTLTLSNTTGAAQTFTYTLRATTANGCFATSTVQVVVNPVAVADAGPSRTTCSGVPVTLGTAALAGSTYQWSPATGLSSATVAQPVLTPSNTTGAPQTLSYLVTVTTAAGCTATSTVQVTVNPAAVADAGSDRAVCSAETTTLGTAPVAGTTYAWSPAAGLSSTTAAQPTFNLPNTGSAPQVHTYTLTATTAQGCTATSTVRVTVNPAAVANAGPDRAVCSSEPTTLGSTPVAGTTYQWSPAAGLSSSTAAQPVFSLANTGTAPQEYTFTLTATTANGCTATSTVRVTVNPAVVAAAGPDRALCSGESTTLGAAAVTGTTYQWSPATGLSSATAAQPVFSLTNTTTTPQLYTFTLTATTANGCVATSTVRVTVNPAAVANAGPNTTLCDGQQVTLGTAALPGYSYQWSPATGLSNATTARPVLMAVNRTGAPLTLTYTLTATTAQNCTATSTVRVTVNPRPAADSIQGSVSVCPTVQGVAYSIRNPRGTAYQWRVQGGTVASGQGTSAITVNWGTASTTASVQVFQLNAFGCSSDTVVLPVRVNQQLATARPTGPVQVCQTGGPFTYQTQYTNGSVYAWQVVGGTQVSTSQASIQVNFTQPGLAKLVVTESSNPAGGICRGVSDTLYVNVLPGPATNLAITGPSRVCASTTSLSFALPGAATSTYAFTLNGTTLTGTGNTVSLPTPAASATPYTLTIRETNANGCVGQVYTKAFEVVAPLTIAGPPSYCPEARTGLTYSVANFPGGLYQWTVTGATLVSGQGTNAVRLDVPAGSGNVTLSVTETTSQSCAATFTIRPDNATVSLTAASVDAAANDRSVTLALAVPNNTGNTNQVRIMRRDAGSTATFTAVGTAANTATSFTDKTADADANAYEYRVDLTNACGTLLSSTQHTTILTKATAAEATDTRQQGTVQVTWTAYQGFTVQEYRVSRVADNGMAEQIAVVNGATLTYALPSSRSGFSQCFRVQAISTDAVARTASSNDACVTFENKLGFYNIITPNADGKNDVLVIDNVQLYPSNTLSVYNRYGKQVYETRNYRNNFGGEGCGNGVYYYLFKLDNGTSYKGWFEIAR
ncbi:T9SS type B sorting domain-containing protein [Hymenobacter sublimis]|uniref:Gliding motility-associated C-terminal domain-containing protein n=1 Tax=Hymenobacter sublimis TaxID=2933777 RepID=A0ABY4J4U5_9BACT|nr:gliding motility-associated C-terminal domain-containing protein [Hymenobacter sublimis]UPL47773.1 gliding motility-associated C-terminal domain-containing protein [Hymenobacter sublimis]